LFGAITGMSQVYFWNKSSLWKFTMEFLGALAWRLPTNTTVLATKSPNPADKARLLQMAQAWHELAAKLDAKQPTGKNSA